MYAIDGPQKAAEIYRNAEALNGLVLDFAGLETNEPEELPDPPCVRVPSLLLDWNDIVRYYDDLLDEMEQIYSIEPYLESRAKAREFDFARQAVKLQAPTWESLQEQIDAGGSLRRILSEDFARFLEPYFVPTQSILDNYGETTMRRHVAVLGYALTAYHRDRGRYPGSLRELAPTYVREIPTDLFSGRPLQYKLSDNGCVLYSLGRNRNDDGGRFDWQAEPRKDDIAVVLTKARQEDGSQK